jgi:hypothetical protein
MFLITKEGTNHEDHIPVGIFSGSYLSSYLSDFKFLTIDGKEVIKEKYLETISDGKWHYADTKDDTYFIILFWPNVVLPQT